MRQVFTPLHSRVLLLELEKFTLPGVRDISVTICPSCGFLFEGDLRDGCQVCGARSVGDPLPRVVQELPAYGRSLALVMTGVAMILMFLFQTMLALVEKGFSQGDWNWIAAAETAAWRLKWILAPITFVVLWGGI